MNSGEERYRWAESKPRGRLWPRAFDGYFIPELSLNPKLFSEASAAGGCGSTWLRTRCRPQSLWPAARWGHQEPTSKVRGGGSSLFSPPQHSQHGANQRKCWRKNTCDGALEKGSWERTRRSPGWKLKSSLKFWQIIHSFLLNLISLNPDHLPICTFHTVSSTLSGTLVCFLFQIIKKKKKEGHGST